MNLQGRTAAATAALVAFGFNPHQRRGPDGRWIKMGDSELKRPRRSRRPNAAGWLAEAKNGSLSPAAEQQIRDAFTYVDPQTGMRAEPRLVLVPPAGEGVRAYVDIYNESGQRVGEALRGIVEVDGVPRVHHTSFELNESARNGGFSSRWLREMEGRYRKAGIEEIALSAVNVGGYAWAKAGFDFDNPFAAAAIAKRFKDALNTQAGRNLSPEATAKVQELADRVDAAVHEAVRKGSFDVDMPSPAEFAMVGWAPGETEWFGKQQMVGSSWQGVKRL